MRSACRRRAEFYRNASWLTISRLIIRRAARDDVRAIVAMLADDPLGGARERLEDPLPPTYFARSTRLGDQIFC